MTPQDKYDFNEDELLAKIREHRKLRGGKYGHRSSKRVKIKLSKGNFYLVNSYFIDYLMSKFGNISFYRALNKYYEEK